MGSLEPAPRDALDLWCGSRPYEDLLPSSVRWTGLDVTNPYGVADIVTDEFLPFDDASFDLVLCTEAFYYVPDPVHGAAEIRRVLRPGGAVIITCPLVWEYDPTILEHRYTGPELASFFEGWDAVRVRENGGRAVAWATLTGRLLHVLEQRAGVLARPLFAALYLAVNGIAAGFEAADRRYQPVHTLPMNVMVSARRPAD